MDLMELLQKGDVEGFNGQRPEAGKLDLFAADLAEKNLVGVDLSRANLDKSDFTESDLSDSTLLGTSMTGIDGSGMKLSHTLAIKVRLKEAWLDKADLSEGDFTRGNFKEAVLESSVGTGAIFAGARFIEANIKKATWHDAELVEANLHKADLTDADLRRADLSEASGQEIVFDGANLEGAVASHARFAMSSFKGAILVGARFLGANLSECDLSEANLSMADLTGANLTGATLTGANLRGTVFADAVLDGVDFTGLDLTGVDLSGVDPTPLNLTAEQKKQAGAVGVDAPSDAPVSAKKALAACAGSRVAVLWENDDGEAEDGEPTSSLRYAVFTGRKVIDGVVPVPSDKALARTIGPDGDGFRMAVLRERPGGVALVCYRVEADGTLSGATSNALGYEPMVWPVLGEDKKGPVLWGLARRGPTLAVHRPSEEGMGVVYSDRVATARGFLGKHHPVITCKGDVIQVATARSAGAPRRTPDGFPGRLGSAAPVGDRLFCCWVLERVGDAAGGLRYAWLESRGTPETMPLTVEDAVLSLDVLGMGNEAWVAWVEFTPEGGRAFRVKLPDGKVEALAPELDASRVCLASGDASVPTVVITLDNGSLAVVGAKGKVQTLE